MEKPPEMTMEEAPEAKENSNMGVCRRGREKTRLEEEQTEPTVRTLTHTPPFLSAEAERNGHATPRPTTEYRITCLVL